MAASHSGLEIAESWKEAIAQGFQPTMLGNE